MKLKVIQDGTGGHTLSWSANAKFPGWTPPTLTATANAVDVFFYLCGGTNFYLLAQCMNAS